MNHRGAYAPIGKSASANGPARAPDRRELRVQPGVAGVEDAGRAAGVQRPPAPQRPVAVGQPRAPRVLAGTHPHAQRPDRARVPPVQLLHPRDASAASVRATAGGASQRAPGGAPPAPARSARQVVVVVVRVEHQVARRPARRAPRRRVKRRGPANGTGDARSPNNRVDEHVAPADLQHGTCCGRSRSPTARRRRRAARRTPAPPAGRRRHARASGAPRHVRAAHQHPAQQRPDARARAPGPRVAEAAVARRWSGVLGSVVGSGADTRERKHRDAAGRKPSRRRSRGRAV
jgi:hypothetical protein